MHLDKALSFKASRADSYYLMAYAFYLLDMLPQAVKYLRGCLVLSARHELALKLQALLAAGDFPPCEVQAVSDYSEHAENTTGKKASKRSAVKNV